MVLNNFFDKFIFTSQLKFKEYNFFVMDIPFAIVPTESLLGVCALDDPAINKAWYYACKSSTLQTLLPKFQAGATKGKFLELSQTFFSASGWGLFKNIQIDDTNRRATVVVSHSPWAKLLQGKVTHPICHFTRAIIGAVFSQYFGTNVEAVETECLALHPGDCTFVVKPLSEFDFTKEETQRQLSLSNF